MTSTERHQYKELAYHILNNDSEWEDEVNAQIDRELYKRDYKEEN